MMYNKAELSLVKNKYFNVIRIEDRMIMVQSKNTGHCWMLFKKVLDEDWPLYLYHKHALTDEWFHEHKKCKNVAQAVREIKKHDTYVIAHPNYLKKKRNGHRYA